MMRIVFVGLVLISLSVCVAAQESTSLPAEKRVALSERAIALDGTGAPALEGTLRTTALNGAEDSPVTNIRLVIRNASSIPFSFVSGLVTFYDSAGVRCGEGLFKADALSVDESFETDTPGIRIRCSPSTWRIIATNLLPRAPILITTPASAPVSRAQSNLTISVDGEEHPIQLDKPMVIKFGDVQRTIVLRAVP